MREKEGEKKDEREGETEREIISEEEGKRKIDK